MTKLLRSKSLGRLYVLSAINSNRRNKYFLRAKQFSTIWKWNPRTFLIVLHSPLRIRLFSMEYDNRWRISLIMGSWRSRERNVTYIHEIVRKMCHPTVCGVLVHKSTALLTTSLTRRTALEWKLHSLKMECIRCSIVEAEEKLTNLQREAGYDYLTVNRRVGELTRLANSSTSESGCWRKSDFCLPRHSTMWSKLSDSVYSSHVYDFENLLSFPFELIDEFWFRVGERSRKC